MAERTYSEEDIAKVVAFYNIHKYSKTYKQMASEYGIPLPYFYYLINRGTQKVGIKGRAATLAYIAKTKRKYGWCSIKATASILKVPYKQIEKWLIDTGYEASMVGGFVFSSKYINKIVNMYKAGNSVFEIITVTTPISLPDVDAMQKLIDNNCTSAGIKLTNKVYTPEEIQGCVELVNSGASIKKTAREKGIPESTIRGWIKKDSKTKEVMDGFINDCGGDLVTVLGECVEHKTGDTIKTQPTLQDRLKEIEHKIAEHNIEIKKLEGYRDTLKQAILILNAGL